MSWLLHGGGYDAMNELYNQYDMEFIGWWIPGPESLSSTKPIRGVDDFKNWKFRSPPGIITMTNYPGFHSMPADHLACRKDVWDGMPAHHQAILKIGMQALALRNTTINEVKNAQNSVILADKGLNMYEWSPEELGKYRTAVQEAWVEFATTPEAKSLLESHLGFLRDIGAME